MTNQIHVDLSKKSKGTYRPDIDGLRAVAVMAVVLHHFWTRWVPGGFVGVDVFFVISGYLITKIIHREMEEGKFTFASFYERRIRRLFPALFAVLAFVLVVGWFVLLPSDYLATFRATIGTVLFSANLVFWRDMQAGYFAADAKLNPLLHMWSLGVEEQFYLFFPVALILIHRYARRWLLPALVIGLAVSFGLSVALTPIKPVAAFFLLPTRAWEMLAGSLLAVVHLPQLRHKALREFLAIVALLAIICPVFLYSFTTPFPGYAALLPVAGTTVLLWLGSGAGTGVGYLLQLRPVVYIGLISYSLYLWHWPLIVFARYQNALLPIDRWIPALLLLSILLAALSHRYIESRYRHRRIEASKTPLFAASGLLMLAVLLVSASGIVTKGYEKRVSDSVLSLDRESSPSIPFVECDGRVEGCRIGAVQENAGAPSLLFWGDSHMLAWAPVIDSVLKKRGISATLQVASACPPVFDIINELNKSCGSYNQKIRDRVEAGEFDALVIAAFWPTYQLNFSDKVRNENNIGGIVSDGLPVTISAIKRHGVRVYLIGPVPEYEQDVPKNRAIFAMQKNQMPVLQTRAQYLGKHAYFYEAAAASDAGMLLDPSEKTCVPDCLLADSNGIGFYRDAHHLSAHGAMFWDEQFDRLVVDALERSAQSRVSK